jgi:hypothetical protein
MVHELIEKTRAEFDARKPPNATFDVTAEEEAKVHQSNIEICFVWVMHDELHITHAAPYPLPVVVTKDPAEAVTYIISLLARGG